MNPERIRTLHDDVEIPPAEPARVRDPHRALRVWSWVVLAGAPLCTLLLFNDLLWLPNGAHNDFSSAAALRDSIVLGKPNTVRNGAHSASMGIAWPNLYVVAWEDDDGWHAAGSNESAYQDHFRNGTPPVPWTQGGDVMIWMPEPGSRVGLWAITWKIDPYLQAMDPATALLNTATLPPKAMVQIRAALVRIGGARAGTDFDRAGAFMGFTMARRLVPLGLAHNVLALAMLVGAIVGWALWPWTLRRYRRFRRGLCLACAYSLDGVSMPRCPECGRAFRRSAAYPRPAAR